MKPNTLASHYLSLLVKKDIKNKTKKNMENKFWKEIIFVDLHTVDLPLSTIFLSFQKWSPVLNKEIRCQFCELNLSFTYKRQVCQCAYVIDNGVQKMISFSLFVKTTQLLMTQAFSDLTFLDATKLRITPEIDSTLYLYNEQASSF